jgi:thiol-disulfide isomerase/thioredoxin
LEITGGKTYNELYIRSWQQGSMSEFAGETVNGYQWTFTIPDSVVEKTTSFEIRSPDSIPPIITPMTTYFRYISFLGIIQGDTLKSNMFHFEKDEMHIHLKAKYHRTVPEINYQYIPSLDSTFALQGWYVDYFLINPKQNRFMRENMITPLGFFFDSFDTEKYNDFLVEFAAKIKENPNSLYYINELASTASYYKSSKDIKRLYFLFSDEMQHSYFGKVVHRYFDTFKINNILLTNTDTKTEEKIVSTPNKYTLLIFSASWCAPCRKEIPVLKKIYEKTNGIMDMVYITIDDEKRLSQWEELMHRENIPWRSLSLGNNNDLRGSWSIRGVPDYILINPTLEARKITLKDENDISSLYSSILNN